MIVAKKAPRGSAGGFAGKRIKLTQVKAELDDSESADSADDGVRISRDGKLYHVGSLHVAVLLESTTDCPCAEHKTNQTYSGSRTPTM